MQGSTNLIDAFEAHRVEIARQVNDVAERASLPASELTGSLATCMRVRANGSLSIYQPGATVTLTRSQALELMDRIAAGVLRAQGAVS